MSGDGQKGARPRNAGTPAGTPGSSVCRSCSPGHATGHLSRAADAKANEMEALSACPSRDAWTETPKCRTTDSGRSRVAALQAPGRQGGASAAGVE